MDKRSAMDMVNEHLGNRLLYGRNTSLANISGKEPKRWWMTIDPSKFKSDLHLLLAKEGDGGLIWLRIKGNAFPDVSKVFRVRQDNGHKGWIEWGIASRPPKYMTDVWSGGTEYDFTKHIEHEWGRPAWTAPGTKGAGTGKGGAERVLTVQRLVEKVESVREEKRMDKNLVVSLDEIKGIRLQCKKCGGEVVVSPTNPYLHGQTCPQGDRWQERPLSQKDNIYMFLSALRQLIESPAPFKAVRLEIDAKLDTGELSG